jgi:hypothetical protein
MSNDTRERIESIIPGLPANIGEDIEYFRFKLRRALKPVPLEFVCPVCSREMHDQHCKRVCECGYFIGCSE